MNTTANASKAYLRSTVLTAPPEQLHLMLVDGAIRYSQRGREAIERKDLEGTFNALERAQRIVLQLSAGLQRDVNPTLVDQMSSLYHFVYRRLIDANLKRDTNAVDEALQVLRDHRETWTLVIAKLASEAGTETREARDGPTLSIEG